VHFCPAFLELVAEVEDFVVLLQERLLEAVVLLVVKLEGVL
jgi:hypothetical protein